jgi:hypothetical protein
MLYYPNIFDDSKERVTGHVFDGYDEVSDTMLLESQSLDLCDYHALITHVFTIPIYMYLVLQFMSNQVFQNMRCSSTNQVTITNDSERENLISVLKYFKYKAGRSERKEKHKIALEVQGRQMYTHAHLPCYYLVCFFVILN